MHHRFFSLAFCAFAGLCFLFASPAAHAQHVVGVTAYSRAVAPAAVAPAASYQPVVTLVPEVRGFFRRRLVYRPVVGLAPAAAPVVAASPVAATGGCCGGAAPTVAASPIVAPTTVLSPVVAPQPILLNANWINVLRPPPTSYYAVPY